MPGATSPNVAHSLLADPKIERDRSTSSGPCSAREFAFWSELENVNDFVVGENRLWLGNLHAVESTEPRFLTDSKSCIVIV